MAAMREATAGEYLSVVRFMNREARLLDDHQWSEWGELLAADIDYRVPIRLTVNRAAASAFSSEGFHMIEDLASLKTRIAKLNTRSSLSEDPPTRSRRFVTNIQVDLADAAKEAHVISNLLLYRERGDSPPDIVSAERHDVLRANTGGAGGFLLARRLVLLDQTSLRTLNLIFL